MSKLEELKKKQEELAERKRILLFKKDEKEKEFTKQLMLNKYYENSGWQAWMERNGFDPAETIQCDDEDIQEKIPKMFGAETMVRKKRFNSEETDVWISEVELNKEGKREVTAKIRTYKGISFEAVHYYVNLYVSGVSWRKQEENKAYSSWNMCPGYLKSIKIEVKTELSEQEMKRDPNRWEHYRLGSKVNAYIDLEDAKEHCRQAFERIFGSEDWYLVFDE
jgi:hypothetical protein